MDVKANLYPCAHCLCTGTCKTALNETSCAACVRYHKENFKIKGDVHTGLPCGICGGLGHAEPGTERITKRWPVLLSLSIIWPLFGGLFLAGFFRSEFFTPLLAFAGPVIGAIVSFYFNLRSRQ